jgi:two-component system chemotaxis response regulator CheB
LLVSNNKLLLGGGPQENRWKPSIDVLFRSAAVAFRERCIGIILTGLLNDGTAGMYAIKRCGGVTIIQDPKEAEFPEMPLSVLENIDVDYCLTLEKIIPALPSIFQKELHPSEVPEEIAAEAAIIEKMSTGSLAVSPIGNPTVYACPDCGGMLWEIKNGNLTRYRCHIGHAYSEEDLLLQQTNSMHTTLWIALRIMEERKTLLEKIARQNSLKGYRKTAKEYELKAGELKQHINIMKRILTTQTGKINKEETVMKNGNDD